MRNVLEDRTRSIHEPIKRNSLALFKKPRHKTTSRKGRRSNFFRTMSNFLVNCTSPCRIGMEIWVNSSSMRFSPSHLLSQILEIFTYTAQSLNYYDVLSSLNKPSRRQPTIAKSWMILDGDCLPTTVVSTFNEYADQVFIPYLEKQLQESRRLDVAWDIYIPDSLKESTRKVSGQTKLPGNWLELRPTRRSCSPFWPPRLMSSTVQKPRLCM